MSLESNIIKSGPEDPNLFAKRYRQQAINEQEGQSVFRTEQQVKKEKIGDAAAVVLGQAEERAEQGSPLTKKELADLCISALAQINFEQPDPTGQMTDRPVDHQGGQFSLPEFDYYMALIETATEGVPIKATGGKVTTDGVRPMSAERFRNIFEKALRNLRGVMGSDPELKEVLPNYFREQAQGKPVPLGVPKLASFQNLSDFLDRHS